MSYFIQVFLPRDRAQSGRLHLFGQLGAMKSCNIECRGKADSENATRHGNTARDTTRPWGDAPSGTFAETKPIAYRPAHRTFGNHAIILDGVSGDALSAKVNGRTGLAIHGGRGDDRLVATYGCIRLRDRDMALLANMLGDEPTVVTVQDI